MGEMVKVREAWVSEKVGDREMGERLRVGEALREKEGGFGHDQAHLFERIFFQ